MQIGRQYVHECFRQFLKNNNNFERNELRTQKRLILTDLLRRYQGESLHIPFD